MQTILAVENLNISCRGREIVRRADFCVPAHSVISIVGPSGAGKTTLLRAMNRLLEEDGNFCVQGRMDLNNRPLYGRQESKYELRRQIGLVFQKPTIFPTSIFKNVIFGVRHTSPRSKRAYASLVERCLRDAFLWDEVKDRLQESALRLSIGQQQRLAIARTLAIEPAILLMDEPTASLDDRAASKIEELIVSLKTDRSVVVVTHNMKQARSISDQIVRLIPGPGGTTTEFVDLAIKGGH